MIKKCLSKPLVAFAAVLLVSGGTNVSAGQKNNKSSVPVAATIVIDGCDSGIADQVLDGGGTMNDLIAACASSAANHGAFVSCVAQLTNAWKKEGLIDGQAKGAIQRCAASADIPPASNKQCRSDADCDDGLYCNGPEACLDKTCRRGTPVDCPDDGLFCNGVESCDEASDSCMSSGDPCVTPSVCNEDSDICGCGSNADCDDGLFCNGFEVCAGGVCGSGTPVDCPDNGIFCDGIEYCDEGGDACASSGDPCGKGYVCNEENNICDPAAVCACGDGVLCGNEQCDDGNTLSGDCCSENCTFEATGSPCSDNIYCNGAETCNGAGVCQPGTSIDCNDGTACTTDACNETTDNCEHIPDDAYCSDGQYCNGIEVCDPVLGCQPGMPVDCPDNGVFCDGTEFCDENGDTCASSGDPCGTWYVCNEENDSCDPAVICQCGDGILCHSEQCDDGNRADGDCCDSACQFEEAGSPCPDGVYCNGAETCDGAGVCLPGTPVDCADEVACTEDVCNEATDECNHVPDNAACNDMQYCNGSETCDPVLGCQPGTPVDCPDNGVFCDGTEFCDENGDTCASSGDPCGADTACNEENDTCNSEVACACGDGVLCGDEQCDDANIQSGDCCSENCTLEATGSPCSDGVYCNGAETCDGAGVCLPGIPIDCNDGIACTVDICDETIDSCVHLPDNAYCSDGLYCNGSEVCDPVSDCQPGVPVACPDNGAFCDGTETCDEESDTCISSGDPCAPNGVCDEQAGQCLTLFGASLKRMYLIWQQAR